jgi:hypothetical protein
VGSSAHKQADRNACNITFVFCFAGMRGMASFREFHGALLVPFRRGR